jgi:hypothetical protein
MRWNGISTISKHLASFHCVRTVCHEGCAWFDFTEASPQMSCNPPIYMVWYPHECCLLERGNETLWMDDPSQPQPQHKHLRRISPGTRSAYAAEQWCQAG